MINSVYVYIIMIILFIVGKSYYDKDKDSFIVVAIVACEIFGLMYLAYLDKVLK